MCVWLTVIYLESPCDVAAKYYIGFIRKRVNIRLNISQSLQWTRVIQVINIRQSLMVTESAHVLETWIQWSIGVDQWMNVKARIVIAISPAKHLGWSIKYLFEGTHDTLRREHRAHLIVTRVVVAITKVSDIQKSPFTHWWMNPNVKLLVLHVMSEGYVVVLSTGHCVMLPMLLCLRVHNKRVHY